MMRSDRSDCEILINGAEDVFNNLGSCLESAFDERQSKMSVVKNLFKVGGSLTKLAFNTTSCAVKHAPKAVVAVAAAKRELVEAIEEEINEHQKQIKEDALDEKIRALSIKR
jgi:hypothetical protein